MSRCGGMLISLAWHFDGKSTIGIEESATKIAKSKHNCKIYGVNPIHAERNFMDLEKTDFKKKVSAIFLSPIWGKKYFEEFPFMLEDLEVNIHDLLEKVFSFTWNLALHIPRKTCIDNILKIFSAYQSCIGYRI